MFCAISYSFRLSDSLDIFSLVSLFSLSLSNNSLKLSLSIYFSVDLYPQSINLSFSSKLKLKLKHSVLHSITIQFLEYFSNKSFNLLQLLEKHNTLK